MQTFAQAFFSTFYAVLQVFIVAFAAGFLVRRRIISDDHIKAMSTITVRILLPCLIFADIIKQFYPAQLRIWPVLPLAAVAMVAVGLLAGVVLFARELPQKKDMLSLASLQNAGYLVLPIGSVLFPAQFEEFKLYCFLYFLGISPLLWSLGKYLISSKNDEKFSLWGLITPPFTANVLAVILVFTHFRRFIPSILLDSIEFIGSATVPVATLILGAAVGSVSSRIRPYLFDAVRVAIIKLIFVPVCTIIVLYMSGLKETYPLLAVFFVIQAASAPATAAVIQVKHYGGDEQKIGAIVLYTYLLCTPLLPFWVALWNTISR
jgi:hypothetical protein